MNNKAEVIFEEFFTQFPKYNRIIFTGNAKVKELFDILTEPENIRMMIETNDIAERPALFGVLSKVENYMILKKILTLQISRSSNWLEVW